MAYKPSEARYDGGGQVKYLVYHSPQPLRGGRSSERTRVQRLYFPADATDFSVSPPGTFEKRTGRSVHGVEVRYHYELAAANAERGETRYRLPARESERTKVVELPERARDIRLTDTPPEGPLQAVA